MYNIIIYHVLSQAFSPDKACQYNVLHVKTRKILILYSFNFDLVLVYVFVIPN